MKETPQPHLNGAFYGPSIPPQKSYHRPGRRGGGGCGLLNCCCGCLCSCLFNLIFQILFTILLIAGIILFIFWLIFRPNPVKFHVTEASLTRFDLSPNNTLYYNLALNMSVRNPNKRIGIYYDEIEVRALYKDQRFAVTNLTRFYQGHKKTDYLSPVFKGQNLLVLEKKDLSKFNSEKDSGSYSIDVKLFLRVRFKLALFKTMKFKPKIECNLKVPLDTKAKVSGNFTATKCDFDWRH